MTQEEILKLWRGSLGPGDQVRHIADWKPGRVQGKTRHPMFDLDVDFGPGPLGGPSPVHARNLYPEWWPAPEWARARS